MKNTKVVQALDKAHGKALEALGTMGARVDAAEAQLVGLRAQRAAILERHSLKSADAIVAGATVPATPDMRKLDSEIEVQEGVKRELAKRRRTQADDEIAARLRALDGVLKSEKKRESDILKQIVDAEQSILRLKADAVGSRERQASLAEDLKEAERVAGDGLVCGIVGDLDTIEAAIEDPVNLIDRIAARKQLARWRAGDPELQVQNIEMVDHFKERKIIVLKGIILFNRSTGRILDTDLLEWRNPESPMTNTHIMGAEGLFRIAECQAKIENYEEQRNAAQ